MNPYPFNVHVTKNQLSMGVWNTSEWNGVKIDWNDLIKYSTTNTVNKLHNVFEIVQKNFDN